MRSLIAILIFLHSISALCSDPNTQARFFETVDKHLATGSSRHTGYYPYEESFMSFCTYGDSLISYIEPTCYYQSFYRKEDGHQYYTYPSGSSNNILATYDDCSASECEIVPGIFAKTGMKIIKVKNFKNSDSLYISYHSIEAQNLIQNMILAKSLTWEPIKLPVVAYLFDERSLFGSLPKELMHIIASSSYFGSAKVKELYIDLYW